MNKPLHISKPLVVIPARGGSKGIPGKNIKHLGGKPLIAYSIEAAREVFDADVPVCVSTDSEDIMRVAADWGADVPFRRPAELAADHTPTRDVLLHALHFYRNQGYDADALVLLQPTSPFRRACHISGAMELYRTGVDMVVSVCEASANPYYDLFETDASGALHVSKGDGRYTRRQDAPSVWQYNGAVYVITPASLEAMPLGEFPCRIPYVMDRRSSLDIDTPLDWQMAERMIEEERHMAAGKEN